MPVLSTLSKFFDKYGPLIQTGGDILGKTLGAHEQNQGFQNAQNINTQGAQQSIAAILGMYDQSKNSLNPFTQYASPAMAKLASYSGITAPTGKDAPQQSDLLNKIMNGQYGGSGGFGLGTSTVNPNEAAIADIKQQEGRGLKGGLIGTGVGIGGAALASGLGLTGTALTSLIPIVGPIAAGVGMLIGKLWNNHNPDKAEASRLINDVSQQIWGPDLKGGQSGIIHDMQTGKLTKEQANRQVWMLWDGWIQNMRKAGVDQSIIDRSIKSQSEYFKNVFDLVGPHPAGGSFV